MWNPLWSRCIYKFPTKSRWKYVVSHSTAFCAFFPWYIWNRLWWILERFRLNWLVLPRFHVSKAPEAPHQRSCCRTTYIVRVYLWFFMEGFLLKTLKGAQASALSGCILLGFVGHIDSKLPLWAVGKSSSPGRPCVGSLCRTKAGARKRSCAKPPKTWSSRKNCHFFGGRCYSMRFLDTKKDQIRVFRNWTWIIHTLQSSHHGASGTSRSSMWPSTTTESLPRLPFRPKSSQVAG